MWGLVPFGAEQCVMERTATGRWTRRLLGELHYGIRLRGYYLARALNGLDESRQSWTLAVAMARQPFISGAGSPEPISRAWTSARNQ
jgi:hypothetical protein